MRSSGTIATDSLVLTVLLLLLRNRLISPSAVKSECRFISSVTQCLNLVLLLLIILSSLTKFVITGFYTDFTETGNDEILLLHKPLLTSRGREMMCANARHAIELSLIFRFVLPLISWSFIL